MAALMEDSRLTGLYVVEQKGQSKVGAVYIGKVKNVVKNIDACFVEIDNGELCFLSLKEANHAFLLNRPADGRILQEDEILVQVQRDAIKTKQAGLTARINLSTDYFVFSFGSPKLGISSKLSKECKDGMKKLLGFPPAMVFMLLERWYGVLTVPENDVMGAVTQIILQELTGQTVK